MLLFTNIGNELYCYYNEFQTIYSINYVTMVGVNSSLLHGGSQQYTGVNTLGPHWSKILKSLEPPFSISRTFRAPPLMPENISVPPLTSSSPPPSA
jgi:hypothetical protein